MVSQRFQFNLPTLAIVKLDGPYAVEYVPANDIVTVTDGPLNGGRLVDVDWNGKAAMMFVTDLRERATQVQEAAG